jgi:hypothetical protein
MDDRNTLSIPDKLKSARQHDLVTITYYNDIKILTSLTGKVVSINENSLFLECAMKYDDWISNGKREGPMEIRIVPVTDHTSIVDFTYLSALHIQKKAEEAIRAHTRLYSDDTPDLRLSS